MSEERRTKGTDPEGPAPSDGAEPAAGGAPSPLRDALVEAQARVVELERRVAELEQQLTAERAAATDYMQRWQRAQADFANLKRRAQAEQEQQARLQAAQALAAVLPALDSIERAFATLPPALRHLTWVDGIGLVHLQLHSALRAAGIKALAAEPGQSFDPRHHEAIGEVESAEHPEGRIAAVIQQGYEVGGIALRPALVQLARAPQSSGAGEAARAGPGTPTAASGETGGQGPSP